MVVAAQRVSMDLLELAELVSDLDSTVLILLFTFALHKGWLHLPREIVQRDHMIRKTEEQVTVWKRLFLDAVEVADRAAEGHDDHYDEGL